MEALVEEAATYDKCLAKIKEKYGPGVLVSRVEKGRTGGILGLFEKDVVRLVFTIQNKPFVPEDTDKSKNNKQMQEQSNSDSANSKQKKAFTPPDDQTSRIKILKEAILQSPEIAEKIHPLLRQKQAHNDIRTDSQNNELRLLNETVKKLAAQINEKRGFSEEHENIKKIITILEENDFTGKYIYTIKEKINNELTLKELDNFEFLQKKVIEWIAATICIKPENNTANGKVIALVGPTGIGKTTTLAKLAAYYLLAASKKAGRLLDVRMITLDQYRIGASFQIQKYCEHMKIPLAIADSPNDLHKYLSLYKNSADIICIDTTGRSPVDTENILKMQSYFEVIDKENSEIYLIVSAVTKPADIREIMRQYGGFKYSSLIITKLDETLTTGSIISILAETGIPITYVTTGQKVPNDIERASLSVFLKKLKGFNLEYGYGEYIKNNFNDERPIVWEKWR